MWYSCCTFDKKQVLHFYGLVFCTKNISGPYLGCSLVVLVRVPLGRGGLGEIIYPGIYVPCPCYLFSLIIKIIK